MTRSVSTGLNNSPVGDPAITSLDFDIVPLNFEEDFRLLEESAGKNIYADITTPVDQLTTLTIAQRAKANVYAGSSIDPNSFLDSKAGTDILIERREIWVESDSTDPTHHQFAPVRAALSLTIPTAASIDGSTIEDLISRLVASVAAQGKDELHSGLNDILHGVVRKG